MFFKAKTDFDKVFDDKLQEFSEHYNKKGKGGPVSKINNIIEENSDDEEEEEKKSEKKQVPTPSRRQ